MKFTVTFRAEQEVTDEPVELIESVESPTEADLKRAIPRLLIAVGQTGLVHYEPALQEWRLIPSSRLRNIRATYSSLIVPISGVSLS